MIMMRIFLPLTTSCLRVARIAVTVALATAGIASCGVDSTGLNSMPFLPHDAAADTVGTGVAGSAGSGSGTAGAGGRGGSATGIAGSGGSVADAGATGTGDAGASGSAGTAGSAGGSVGTAGTVGSGGVGGDAAGEAGSVGTAGTGGDSVGTAGTGGGVVGTAGAGGSSVGTAGIGGTAGTGVAGTGGRAGASGRGGAGGGVPIPCTAATCADGCCKDSTTCIRMRSAMQCGANGAACAPCGGCQICSTFGQCKIDPTSRWKLMAVSAQLQNKLWDRPAGDLGGTAPDPFCEFENPAGQVTTSTAGVSDTLIDTYDPTWNQEITPAGTTVSAATLMATSPAWQIWVGDDDGCNPGQSCLGDVACTIRQTISETQLKAGQLVVNGRQSCINVTIGLVCQPLFAASAE
jgi:hypothetical protein